MFRYDFPFMYEEFDWIFDYPILAACCSAGAHDYYYICTSALERLTTIDGDFLVCIKE